MFPLPKVMGARYRQLHSQAFRLPAGAQATVNYATADDTARAGSDYQTISGTLTFSPGETAKTVNILINGDTTFEPNETFFLNLNTFDKCFHL